VTGAPSDRDLEVLRASPDIGTLACEPTGHRWKPLVVTARAGKIPAVCVQPLLVRRARERRGLHPQPLGLRRCRGHRPANGGAALLPAIPARGAVRPTGKAGEARRRLPRTAAGQLNATLPGPWMQTQTLGGQ
jgi:hypothetical protein